MRGGVALVLACLLAVRVAQAQPGLDVPTILHDANAYAIAGNWQRVDELVEPLLLRPLVRADLAEAHRLTGLAAFFTQQRAAAESHFLAYLELDLEARLDPTLVPPEAITFFEDVRSRHAAELRARRPKKQSLALVFLPPGGQFQAGERVKGWILGGALFAFLATNVTTYFVLRSWCSQTFDTCDATTDHTRGARDLRTVNVASGVALIATYLYGLYDGVVAYRRFNREQLMPYASFSDGEGMFGVGGAF
jgi:hypothetical protein